MVCLDLQSHTGNEPNLQEARSVVTGHDGEKEKSSTGERGRVTFAIGTFIYLGVDSRAT
jgi:hypothetical protein